MITESVPYLVLLEFRQSEPPELSNGLIIDVADDNSSDKDSNDYSVYTVPFKVLRVAYKGRQTYLKKAYEFGTKARGNSKTSTITTRMQ